MKRKLFLGFMKILSILGIAVIAMFISDLISGPVGVLAGLLGGFIAGTIFVNYIEELE